MNRVTRCLSLMLLTVLVGLSACSSRKAEPPDATYTDSVTVALIATDSVTVLELLQEDHRVDFRSSALGAFVTAIDSQANGDGYFWTYRVNGSSIPTACDRYTVGPGDTIVWRFGK